MTSVTFSEENDDLDLEDWDAVGLNRPQPASILSMYRRINDIQNTKEKPHREKNKKRGDDVACEVNMDAEVIESLRSQIVNLNDKQKVLFGKIVELEAEVESIKEERDILKKRIDELIIEKDLSEISIQNNTNLNNKAATNYEKFKFERKVPILFKELVTKLFAGSINETHSKLIKDVIFNLVFRNYEFKKL